MSHLKILNLQNSVTPMFFTELGKARKVKRKRSAWDVSNLRIDESPSRDVA